MDEKVWGGHTRQLTLLTHDSSTRLFQLPLICRWMSCELIEELFHLPDRDLRCQERDLLLQIDQLIPLNTNG